MSIYNTPVDRLTTGDLVELLAAQAIENARLEFKRDVPGPEETLKKLSSFANTYGGHLIVGAEGQSSDGRLIALQGVEPQSNFRQTIIQRCAAGLTPLIEPFVSDGIPTPDDSARVCYVISVPESELAPHFLNGRKGVYVRTDEYSTRYEPRLATADELLHLFDRRQLAVARREQLTERAGNRFATFAKAEYRSGSDMQLARRQSGGVGATLHLALLPQFPVAPLCELERLLPLFRQLSVARQSSRFPYSSTPVTQHESVLALNPGSGFSLLELNVWGLVAYAVEVQRVLASRGARATEEAPNGIHLPAVLGEVLVALEYARLAYDALGFDGVVTVVVRMERVRGVPVFAFPDGFVTQVATSHLDDTLRFSLCVSTERLRTARDEIAGDVVRTLLFALGLSDVGAPGADQTLVPALLSDGYKYNGWPSPR